MIVVLQILVPLPGALPEHGRGGVRTARRAQVPLLRAGERGGGLPGAQARPRQRADGAGGGETQLPVMLSINTIQ